MKNNASSRDCAAPTSTEVALLPGETAMPVWRASVRMALVSAAGVVAAGLIATGLVGCADMSGISPQASLRDAQSLGLPPASGDAARQAPLQAEWWREFGDEALNRLVTQSLQDSPILK